MLEDRKFKSAPSEVIKELIAPEGFQFPKKRKTDFKIEVVLDPDYDCTQLDDPKLQLLGASQEEFLTSWSQKVRKSGQLGAVLSQSPWAHVACTLPPPQILTPMRGRSPVGIEHSKQSETHPWSCFMEMYTLGRFFATALMPSTTGPCPIPSPFSSRASRRWEPLVEGMNREPGRPKNTGQFHDRFGNKVTVHGAGNGINGYAMMTL